MQNNVLYASTDQKLQQMIFSVAHMLSHDYARCSLDGLATDACIREFLRSPRALNSLFILVNNRQERLAARISFSTSPQVNTNLLVQASVS